jgi:signal transduction histidine kinase/ActR/RegA family two-component response regulator/ABC-type phosphate/phosphonate transport system substrate-binding protein
MILSWLVSVILFSAQFASADPGTSESDDVILQLPYSAQFQFAGYYAAQSKGFYREEGLDVHILESSYTFDVVKFVMEGHAQFGVVGSGLVLSRLRGEPVVLLSNLGQHSPLVFFTLKKSGITKAEQLKGKKIAIAGEIRQAELYWMLAKAGVSPGSFESVPSAGTVEALEKGQVDAISGYLSNQPFLLQRDGIQYNVISPQAYGADFYADALFTSEEQVSDHPERVEKFLRASTRGWRYALTHQSELSQYLLDQQGSSNSQFAVDKLQFEVKSLQDFILPGVVVAGHFEAQRWKDIAKLFVSAGLAPKVKNLNGFIYEPEIQFHRRSFYIVGGVISLLAILFFIFLLLNLQLRALVKKRTRELEDKTLLLVQAQKMQAIGTLANGVAHDINNILSVIMLNTSVILQKTRDHDLIKQIEAIRSALEKGGQISKQLLLFSKDKKSSQDPVDLLKLAEQIYLFIKNSVSDEINVSFSFEGTNFNVAGDAGQLYQALLNLAINARDAMSESGGSLKIVLMSQAKTVEVRISDTGIGISKAAETRVFEPFFTTKEFGKGSGLGLSIVHGIVQGHGGHICFESKKNVGTTFIMTLPLLSSSIGLSQQLKLQARPSVLLVEDEVAIREILLQSLVDVGLSVSDAPDGLEAWEQFLKHRQTLRVVVTDLGLPKLRGEDLIQRMLNLNPSLRVIVITGFNENNEFKAFLREHKIQLIKKPFQIEDVMSAVKSATISI